MTAPDILSLDPKSRGGKGRASPSLQSGRATGLRPQPATLSSQSSVPDAGEIDKEQHPASAALIGGTITLAKPGGPQCHGTIGRTTSPSGEDTGTAGETARFYTITHEPEGALPFYRWRAGGDGREYPWALRRYGHGHWCVADGQPRRFHARDEAEAHGRFWDETGRTVADNTGKQMFAEWLAAVVMQEATE